MMGLILLNFTRLCKSFIKELTTRLLVVKHFLEICLLQERIGYRYQILFMNFWYNIIMIHTIGILYQLLNWLRVIYRQAILINQLLYYQMWINLAEFELLPKPLDLKLHPDIKEVHIS